MSFLLMKVLEIGYNRHKKNKAEKKAQKNAELYGHQQPPYPNYPQQPYPMSEYPSGIAPGTDTHYNPNTGLPMAGPASKTAKIIGMLISALRFFQFVFGLTVIGLYGKDVHHDHKDKHEWHSKWVYAVITAFLATVTAIVHLIVPFIMRRATGGAGSASAFASAGTTSKPAILLPQFVWEFILCVLWLTLFGVFGKMYIGVYADEDGKGVQGLGDASKVERMRHACWIDLINLLMWVSTASWVLLRWLKSRRAQAGPVDAEKGEDNSF